MDPFSARNRNNNPAEQPSGVGPGYRFSPEEMKVMTECNKESFFYRSLPLGIALGLGTNFAVRAGKLKASQRYGAGPKIIAAAVIGYFVGKFSYASTCMEKFLHIPNSPIGDELRRRKGMSSRLPEYNESDPVYGIRSGVPLDAQSSPVDTDIDNIPYNLDTDTTSHKTPEGLDDTGRPTIDSSSTSTSQEEKPPEAPSFQSYDDLRQKNRDEYESKRLEAYKRSTYGPTVTPQNEPPKYRTPTPETSQGRQKNEYGDVWDE